MPLSGGQRWTSRRLAISREWVAFKDVAGKVPWNVIPYGAVSGVSPAPGGGIKIDRPDGPGVVLGKEVLASPGASALLAEGLGGNADVAAAAWRLLQPYLDEARRKHGSRRRRLLVIAAGGAVVLAAAVAVPLTLAARALPVQAYRLPPLPTPKEQAWLRWRSGRAASWPPVTVTAAPTCGTPRPGTSPPLSPTPAEQG